MKSLVLALLLLSSALLASAQGAVVGKKVLYFPVDGNAGINLTYFVSEKMSISGEVAYDNIGITVPAELVGTIEDVKVDGKCLRITPGVEYTLAQKDAIRTYLLGRLTWVDASAHVTLEDEEAGIDGSGLYLGVGFGAEYFLSEQFSIAGEYVIRTGNLSTDLHADIESDIDTAQASIDGPSIRSTSLKAATIRVGFHF